MAKSNVPLAQHLVKLAQLLTRQAAVADGGKFHDRWTANADLVIMADPGARVVYIRRLSGGGRAVIPYENVASYIEAEPTTENK